MVQTSDLQMWQEIRHVGIHLTINNIIKAFKKNLAYMSQRMLLYGVTSSQLKPNSGGLQSPDHSLEWSKRTESPQLSWQLLDVSSFVT